MPHQVLHGVELGPCGDVVAARVQLSDLIMLYVVASFLIPVTDGQGVGAWVERSLVLFSLRLRAGGGPRGSSQSPS